MRVMLTTVWQRLDENLGALDVQLSKEDVAEIRKACENVKLGDRYDPARMKLLQQETPPL